MKYGSLSLVAALLLIGVARSYGEDVTAPPEVTTAKPEVFDLVWARTLSYLLRNNDSSNIIEGVSTVAENWLKTAPEFKAAAVAEMKGDGNGVLDYVGKAATSGVGGIVSYLIAGEKSAVSEGRGYTIGQGHTITNAVVPVSTHNFQHSSRIAAGSKSKKKALLKFYILAKMFIYGFIAKAKIGLILFKIFILVKLKFLALAVIHTLIALANLYFQTKAPQHVPQQVVFSGYDQHHLHGNHHQQDFGHGGNMYDGNDRKHAQAGW